MLAIEITPNLAAAQFLPPRQQRRLDRLVSRVARRNRGLWMAIQAARIEAREDRARYESWLAAQAPTTSYDIDLPW